MTCPMCSLGVIIATQNYFKSAQRDITECDNSALPVHKSVDALFSEARVNYNRECAAGISNKSRAELTQQWCQVKVPNRASEFLWVVIHGRTNGVTLYHWSTTGGVNVPRFAAMHKRRLQTRKHGCSQSRILNTLFCKCSMRHLLDHKWDPPVSLQDAVWFCLFS